MKDTVERLDLNLGTVEIFAQAQLDLMGENHAYPMIAFGTLKTSSAFKMYCRSQGLDYQLANDISKQIQEYEKALGQAETQEDKDMIDLYDYVDKKYESYIKNSKKYQGIIDSKSKAPCGFLLYSGDIRREIGLIKCKSESTKKEYITTTIDGYVAEEYKFVKNDLLKVDVANIIKRIYDRIGREQDDIKTLTKLIMADDLTWKIYENGWTLGVNQMESNFGKQCCKKYKPKNVAEMTALVSALRPGFKSMLQTFLNREDYTTGVKTLDALLEDSFHFIMYQENIMTYLGWLGIEQTETYAIIKKISKKKFKEKELKELKDKLSQAWIKNTGSIDGFEESFKVMEDFSKYAFNASHAFAYAYDSLYEAYLKSHYTYEYYETMLNVYTEKGNKNKVSEFCNEMKIAFDISLGKLMWGLDNRQYTLDKENNCIHPCLSSIKGIRKTLAEELYLLSQKKQYTNFIDVLIDIFQETNAEGTMIENLIKLNYFEPFGKSKTLLRIYQVYQRFYKKEKGIVQARKVFDKTNMSDTLKEIFRKTNAKETEKQFRNIDIPAVVNEIIKNYPDENLSVDIVAKTQHELLGYIDVIDESFASNMVIVTNVNVNKWGTPFFDLYQIKTGKILEGLKVDKEFFLYTPINNETFTIISLDKKETKPKKRKNKDTNKWEVIGEELILSQYTPIII